MCTTCIEYRGDIVPGQKHFNCARMHATISTASCADRFARANTAQDWREGRYAVCARCPIGQRHAAETAEAAGVQTEPTLLPDLGAAYCVRCGRSGLRLIASRGICVSCMNREYEAKRGFNARGNPPRDYKEPRPHLIGVLDKDARPTWQFFEGQTRIESLARAIRAGHKIHSERPGRTHWNAERQSFEYRDAGGVMLELEVDGLTEFIPVEHLRPGETPAPVTMPTLTASAEFVREWLDLGGEADELGGEWRFLEFACERCHRGVIQGRRRAGMTQCRCTACEPD